MATPDKVLDPATDHCFLSEYSSDCKIKRAIEKME